VPSSGGVYAPTLRHHDGRFWLVTTDVSGGGTVLFSAADPAGPWSDPVRLLSETAVDPDHGGFTVLAELDGRYLSTEVAGGFTGRVIGLYATVGTVRFDWFDYRPLADPRA
jgi:beta-xylosidase